MRIIKYSLFLLLGTIVSCTSTKLDKDFNVPRYIVQVKAKGTYSKYYAYCKMPTFNGETVSFYDNCNNLIQIKSPEYVELIKLETSYKDFYYEIRPVGLIDG